jgi:alpha-tubulin suppressor-like RCC1 family protein/DNA-directed RNA polymerase subunit RPC12/RpoP
MTIFKCKMCGGDLEVDQSMAIGTCQHCGSTMTLPKASDERITNLFNRANHYRRSSEFDKAFKVYESILNEDDANAEAYWGLVLCRYGIEYVEDPQSGQRIPTCHRAQKTSIFMDADYKQALEYADSDARQVYEQEAKVIDDIQKQILSISAQEEPYDIFICYKETSETGSRTKDSVLSQDIYHHLTEEGHKVFFSRISLEDKLGTAYEPYIFAALNSSKVMIVVATSTENVNAVWTKNEWSRYLNLINKGEKKTMVPVYRDMEAYDLPEEFSHLQALDMSKLGFMQDLVRGVKKMLEAGAKPEQKTETTQAVHESATAQSLLDRAFICLEDGEWSKADELLERALDIEPRNAKAYIGKLMVELHVSIEDELVSQKVLFADNSNYQKALRFADKAYHETLESYKKVGLIFKETAGCISAGAQHVVGLNVDGTVIASGRNIEGQLNIDDWRDIIAVTAGVTHTVGLKHDGTVVAVGSNEFGQLDVDGWLDIIAISAGHRFTVGLKSDGTVVGAGRSREGQLSIDRWRDIIAVSNGAQHTVGLKLDGTVLAVGRSGEGQIDVENWGNIVAVSTVGYHTVGLKSDSTVVAVGGNTNGQLDIAGWSDIIAISAGVVHTVGLKADGTVVAVGSNEFGQLAVDGWLDIIAISAGHRFTVGLKSDGTVVGAGVLCVESTGFLGLSSSVTNVADIINEWELKIPSYDHSGGDKP